MESGAKVWKDIVSGKLSAQFARSMKFKDEYMISSGQPVKEYIDSAVLLVSQLKSTSAQLSDTCFLDCESSASRLN